MPQYVFDKLHKIMKENNIKDYSKIGLYGLTNKAMFFICFTLSTIALHSLLKFHYLLFLRNLLHKNNL